MNYKITNARYSVVGEFNYSEESGIQSTNITGKVLLSLLGEDTAGSVKSWIRNRMSAGSFKDQMSEIDRSGGACLTDEYYIFRESVPTVIAFPFSQGVQIGDKATLVNTGYLFVEGSTYRIGRIPSSLIISKTTTFTVIDVSDRAVVVKCE